MSKSDEPCCPLCGRPFGAARNISRHHLIPMSKGGKKGLTVDMHNICHRKIHATLTNRELKLNYFTIEKLQQHPEIAKFIQWVSTKPPEFYERSRDSKIRQAKRKWKRR